MRKGITNMLRLHGTGAVALPIELRLQILASSRDVIHSWAIPSAGIKIDCIPGYTSHRIMIFFTPGIYWGQCMEICGRYHHWMPIILYFMKRDLFFLWCTHFMSKSDFDTTWGINDRQFTDYVRFVSYDRMTWLTEISKQL
jgi:heme/copper-type cytochrome/quinol oxidase subunit 2